MSDRRRVIIVARHYWPTITDASLRLANWCRRLFDDGLRPMVLTPRWHASWPQQIVCDGVRVLRLEHPPISQLRASRYRRGLVEWVKPNLREVAAIYCDAADGDTAELLSHLPGDGGPNKFVRYDPRELSQNIPAWRPARQTLDACRRADVVVVPTLPAQQQLIGLGIRHSKVARTPDLPGASVDRLPAARSAARAMLARVNHDLFVQSQHRLIVCPGELSHDWGVDLLIEALGAMLEDQRSLKLWILGDGIERSRIYDSLQFAGIHRIVALPGCFTCLDSILQAADLCILPAAGRGVGWALPTCIASAIPLVTADSPEAREILGAHAPELSFAAGQSSSLRAWVADWLSDERSVSKAMIGARAEFVARAHPGTSIGTWLRQAPTCSNDASACN